MAEVPTPQLAGKQCSVGIVVNVVHTVTGDWSKHAKNFQSHLLVAVVDIYMYMYTYLPRGKYTVRVSDYCVLCYLRVQSEVVWGSM